MAMETDIPEELGALFKQLLETKRQGDGFGDDAQALCMAGAVKILELKQAHRNACEATDALREATSDAKTHLDQSSLQLHNLLYERSHYEKEIRACQAFRSAFTEDQLELLHEEEFAQHTAEEVPMDAHQRMMARLRHELSFREEKLVELESLKASRDSLAAEVAQRRSGLSALEAEFSRLRQMAQKVEHQFSIPATIDTQTRTALISFLPGPLYLLYTHLTATVAAAGLPLEVGIGGEDATKFQQHLKQATMVRSPSAPSNVTEAALAQAAEHTFCTTGDDRSASFPLTVTVAVREETAPASLSLAFSYIPALRVVAVACGSEAQKTAICKEFGEVIAAAAAGHDVSTLPGGGMPYAWAQRLAGLENVSPVPPEGESLAQKLHAVREYQRQTQVSSVLERLLSVARRLAAVP